MSNKTRASTQLFGSLQAEEGNGTVRMEHRVEAGVEDVWSALTDRDRLATWLGEVDGDLRLGGEFRARFFASGWEGTGRVEMCEPPSRLLVLTRDADDPDAPDEHVIEVTLSAVGGETMLAWEERPVPVDLLAAYGAGIQIHVEDLLAHLARRDRCDAAARFEELFPAYQELAAGMSE
jgi:uncharacterized protein YndB with AHSA1/START domain